MMKKTTWIIRGLIIASAIGLSACGAFGKNQASGSATADSYQASAPAYEEQSYVSYDYDMEAAEEALYVEDMDAIAFSSRSMASETSGNDSGSGKGESGNGNQMKQTSAGGDEADGGSGDDLPPQVSDPDQPADGTDPQDSVTTRKLITTVSIEAETETLDDILQRVESEMNAIGGYIESSYISQDRTYTGNNTYTNRRRATMTLRVPESKLDVILSVVSGETNVLEESRTTEDVTLTYVDIESRKKSLETQRESLLRLLEQAETVEDIITIEDRLSYVNYEIERMGSQLRTYDNLVDYATVHLTLREVVEYTPVQEEPETVVSRIAKGFSYNVKRVGGGIVDCFVWFVSSLPQMVVFAVVIGIAVKVFRWFRKRRIARKAARAADKTGTAQNEKRGIRRWFGRKKQVTGAGKEGMIPEEDAAAENTKADASLEKEPESETKTDV